MDIDPNLFTGLLSLAGAAIGTLGGIVINTKLSNYRLEQLEKKVEKHNNLIERTYEVEKKVGEIKKDIDHIYHEIDEIKK